MLVAIVVTVLSWASSFVVIRGVGEHFGGGSLALGRLVVGAVLLGVVVLIGRRWVAPTVREWLLIAGFGAFWFAVYNFALNTAEQTIDAGTTSMIVNIGPILIAVGAGVILREGFPRWLGIGAAIAFVGVVLIGIATSSGFGDGIGLIWALVAAVTYAAGVLLQKPAIARLPAAQVTFLGAAIGAVLCLPFSGELVADLADAPPGAVWGMVYLGVVPTALAFSTWAYALGRMPAGQLGVTTYIVPPLVIVMGLLFFGEIPALLAIVGGVVCLVGVSVSRRRSVPRERDDVAVPARAENLPE
ncbi:threonine/homoserine efflux transporter RhtA [Diaminobutyricimonas aerilata]|uniref:Threonine/homoserine efflux transporter RhtA n=1 Tax=Diaminobutyricimonas aerilata TaxID=1162967 RepID=A0A2M9CIJ8_9MICO|nr:threonine/homoserine efflux transporter RhtA [Diaminobutyricimonas aerilata]